MQDPPDWQASNSRRDRLVANDSDFGSARHSSTQVLLFLREMVSARLCQGVTKSVYTWLCQTRAKQSQIGRASQDSDNIEQTWNIVTSVHQLVSHMVSIKALEATPKQEQCVIGRRGLSTRTGLMIQTLWYQPSPLQIGWAVGSDFARPTQVQQRAHKLRTQFPQ